MNTLEEKITIQSKEVLLNQSEFQELIGVYKTFCLAFYRALVMTEERGYVLDPAIWQTFSVDELNDVLSMLSPDNETDMKDIFKVLLEKDVVCPANLRKYLSFAKTKHLHEEMFEMFENRHYDKN